MMMKKYALILATFALSFTMLTAQNLTDCKETCEIEKTIKEGPFLGVVIVNERANDIKVLVKDLVANSAAVKFDIRREDYIISIDGIAMENKDMVKAFVESHKPGDVVSIIIMRDGEEMTKEVTIDAKITRIEKQTICCEEQNEFLNDMNVSLAPNPSAQWIKLSVEKAKEGKYAFQMFNTAGVEVHFNEEHINGAFEKEFDISELSIGQYFLKISLGERSYTTSFVVER